MRFALLFAFLLMMPTCNPEPTFWPSDLLGPPEWGEPCPVAVTDYTVYGRVTVYELTPLAGAEVRVNRIVDGAQTGAGAAMSDANGDYRIAVSGHADALRIYIIYPPEYEPWGVQAPIVSWGLELIHWPNPPASCGPIYWRAQWRISPTPSMTPTRTATPMPSMTPTATCTPTVTQTPTRTLMPSVTPTVTATRLPTKTPVHTPTATATLHAVGLPQLLRMTPANTQLELMQQHIVIGVRLYNLLVGFVGALMVAGAAYGFWKLKR